MVKRVNEAQVPLVGKKQCNRNVVNHCFEIHCIIKTMIDNGPNYGKIDHIFKKNYKK